MLCGAVYAFAMEGDFEIGGQITEVEAIAVNLSIREGKQLKALFGGKRLRKLQGVSQVRFPDDSIHFAEIHRYEAHGVG